MVKENTPKHDCYENLEEGVCKICFYDIRCGQCAGTGVWRHKDCFWCDGTGEEPEDRQDDRQDEQ